MSSLSRNNGTAVIRHGWWGPVARTNSNDEIKCILECPSRFSANLAVASATWQGNFHPCAFHKPLYLADWACMIHAVAVKGVLEYIFYLVTAFHSRGWAVPPESCGRQSVASAWAVHDCTSLQIALRHSQEILATFTDQQPELVDCICFSLWKLAVNLFGLCAEFKNRKAVKAMQVQQCHPSGGAMHSSSAMKPSIFLLNYWYW